MVVGCGTSIQIDGYALVMCKYGQIRSHCDGTVTIMQQPCMLAQVLHMDLPVWQYSSTWCEPDTTSHAASHTLQNLT